MLCILVGEFVIETAREGVVVLKNMEHGYVVTSDAKKVTVAVSSKTCTWLTHTYLINSSLCPGSGE